MIHQATEMAASFSGRISAVKPSQAGRSRANVKVSVSSRVELRNAERQGAQLVNKMVGLTGCLPTRYAPTNSYLFCFDYNNWELDPYICTDVNSLNNVLRAGRDECIESAEIDWNCFVNLDGYTFSPSETVEFGGQQITMSKKVHMMPNDSGVLDLELEVNHKLSPAWFHISVNPKNGATRLCYQDPLRDGQLTSFYSPLVHSPGGTLLLLENAGDFQDRLRHYVHDAFFRMVFAMYEDTHSAPMMCSNGDKVYVFEFGWGDNRLIPYTISPWSLDHVATSMAAATTDKEPIFHSMEEEDAPSRWEDWNYGTHLNMHRGHGLRYAHHLRELLKQQCEANGYEVAWMPYTHVGRDNTYSLERVALVLVDSCSSVEVPSSAGGTKWKFQPPMGIQFI